MTVPVVGALLIFSLMIGPPAAARSFTSRPGYAMALSVGIALVTVWAAIARPTAPTGRVGFFVGVIAAGFFLLGQGWGAMRRRGYSPRQAPVLSAVQ